MAADSLSARAIYGEDIAIPIGNDVNRAGKLTGHRVVVCGLAKKN